LKSDKPAKPARKTKTVDVSATAPSKAAPTTAPAKSTGTSPGAAARPPAPKIPPILLEGDAPAPPAVSGPGQRYSLGTASAAPAAQAEKGELPEAYGTQRLMLTARDPHWLYAHWDMTLDQLRRYNARAADRHLVLRIYRNEVEGEPHREIHLHPESRNWFVHVGLGGTRFVAELGYYRAGGQWVTVAASGATMTPPDKMSDDVSVWFETLPVDLRLEELLRLVRAAVRDQVPLLEALQQLRAMGYGGLPDAGAAVAARWTPEQERALGEIVSMDSVRRVWMGSLEITELIRRQFVRELASAAAAEFSQPGLWSGALGSVSSPYGVPEQRKGFWFNVNAELIIYGATEADATVTIGGRKIRLRPDGTFSYRFTLPDGQYELPAQATAADGHDTRSAGLKFSRRTDYAGDVGQHPQDPQLKPPLTTNVA
jgi:hypothetical protein